jgi:hypothetical protein
MDLNAKWHNSWWPVNTYLSTTVTDIHLELIKYELVSEDSSETFYNIKTTPAFLQLSIHTTTDITMYISISLLQFCSLFYMFQVYGTHHQELQTFLAYWLYTKN